MLSIRAVHHDIVHYIRKYRWFCTQSVAAAHVGLQFDELPLRLIESGSAAVAYHLLNA
jgi:hypothetical protein